MNRQIPWAKPYIGKEEWEVARKCFEANWLSMGNKVKEFEDYMSKLVQSTYAVAVNSGTAALDIALKLIEVKEDDEVIIPALSFIAVGNAVLYQNATPVFADVDPETYTISPRSVQEKLTNKTRAVIAIDYGGLPADYDSLKDILKGRNIFLIEDGAPGLGGRYKDKPSCSRGDISTTSFHMAKICTSVEGGMIFTENKEWAKVARMIRSQGEDPHLKYHYPVLGHNYRMTDLHAAIGLEQVKRFPELLEKREEIADYYSKAFAGLKNIVILKVPKESKHAWFLYPILIPDRDKVVLRLKEKGIQTNVSWPMPIYEQKIYSKYFKEECPVAKRITKTILCLPIYYEMTMDEQDYVIEQLAAVVREFTGD